MPQRKNKTRQTKNEGEQVKIKNLSKLLEGLDPECEIFIPNINDEDFKKRPAVPLYSYIKDANNNLIVLLDKSSKEILLEEKDNGKD